MESNDSCDPIVVAVAKFDLILAHHAVAEREMLEARKRWVTATTELLEAYVVMRAATAAAPACGRQRAPFL
ncbi:hypothetical protein ACFTWF_03155 [Rhodococcus sp. NPDC056960]|uniref:hypothetical protein n=1 Tax=Rhodococcus sp. NPDC056960 TaxID=3345982 RepID=UPI00362B1945